MCNRLAWAALTDTQKADRVAELATALVRDGGVYHRVVRDYPAEARSAIAAAVLVERAYRMA